MNSHSFADYTDELVIEDVGYVRKLASVLNSLNTYTLSDGTMNEEDFKTSLIAGAKSTETLYWDIDGNEIKDPYSAALKMVNIHGHYNRNGNMVYASFVKPPNREERYGPGSPFTWVGAYTGTIPYLLSKWKTYNSVPTEVEKDKLIENAMRKINVNGIVTDSNGDTISESIIRDIEKAHYKSNELAYEELYDMLWDKEIWRDSGGSLLRLANYVNYLFRIVNTTKNPNYIQYGKNEESAVINSRLFSRYSTYICLHIKTDKTKKAVRTLKVIKGMSDAIEYGHNMNCLNLEPYNFFQDVRNVTFSSKSIDEFDLNDISRLEHIVKDRNNRLPEHIRTQNLAELVQRIRSAVDFAIRMSRIDYRFVLPMYNLEYGKIQFLMPFYTKLEPGIPPDCVLVVNQNSAGGWSLMTVLDLESAYKNARILNKTDTNWLMLE